MKYCDHLEHYFTRMKYGDLREHYCIQWMSTVEKGLDEYSKIETDVWWHPVFERHWYEISANPNVTIEYITNHPDKFWRWGGAPRERVRGYVDIMDRTKGCGLLGNPNMTTEFLRDHLQTTWKRESHQIKYNLPTHLNMADVSFHPKITMEVVLANLELEWLWSALSFHQNITLDDVLAHSELPWDWNFVARNPNVTMEHIHTNSKLAGIDGAHLSCNPNMDAQYILAHPEMKWDWRMISRCKTLSSEDIQPLYQQWDWDSLSMNATLTLDLILENLEAPWNWRYLSHRPFITEDFVKTHLNLVWEWGDHTEVISAPGTPFECILEKDGYGLSNNPNISWRFVKKHFGEAWGWDRVSEKEAITIREVLDYPDLPWCWNALSKHPAITYRDIEANPELPWVWREVSRNPNVTLDIVVAHPDQPWNQRGIANNPNVTMEYIQANPVTFDEFVHQPMERIRHEWILDYRRRCIAVLRLQRFWRDVSSNPVYATARRLLLLEYENSGK